MTKTDLIIDCIKRASSAYSALETAKGDCEEVVDDEIENLVAICEEKITTMDKKNIKKIAKAVASQKVGSLAKEAKSLAGILLELMAKVDVDQD